MVVNLTRTSTSAELLKQVFHRVNGSSCPRVFNFHMHTAHSDGKLKPCELMEQAIAIGLQGLAITDHHTINGYKEAQRFLEYCQHPHPTTPYLWTGVEINANLLDIEVHILAYGFEPANSSIQPYLQGTACTGEAYKASNIIAAIHDAGGLAVLAHPARYRRSHFELIPAATEQGIDGVETFYAYNNPKPWQPSGLESQEVQQLAAEYHLFNTCGTDTHGLNLLHRL